MSPPDGARRRPWGRVVAVALALVVSMLAYVALLLIANVSLCGLFGCYGGWGSGGQRNYGAPIPWIVAAGAAGAIWVLALPVAWPMRALLAASTALLLGLFAAFVTYTQ